MIACFSRTNSSIAKIIFIHTIMSDEIKNYEINY